MYQLKVECSAIFNFVPLFIDQIKLKCYVLDATIQFYAILSFPTLLFQLSIYFVLLLSHKSFLANVVYRSRATYSFFFFLFVSQQGCELIPVHIILQRMLPICSHCLALPFVHLLFSVDSAVALISLMLMLLLVLQPLLQLRFQYIFMKFS